MVKIKRKVEMTLPELIEWGFKNGIKNKEFVSNFFEKKSVIFNLSGWAEFSDEYAYLPEDTFIAEIEEEITKETKLPKCLEISFDRKSGRDVAVIHENWSVKQLTDNNPEYLKGIRTFHLVNDDGTVELIWKDGELVGDE
ncbi:hypothetical protein IDG47_13235 [Staphylococcus sp. EG-SA-6]|uniref:hypothetical protein n=1 Tax=Staphylococcus haemolyticus TaxID=1283 RepID=UPI00066AA459|nr:hypothetical protein [Staphylococcus haemolyticus]MBN4933698.1 hypothetical protein [Staphylococcus sp. EG-SA-6]AYX83238.1 hypothetical protein EGX85_02225 [Staphylococcus haemolyticus]MBW4892100.1 hypothetical protein [Staphylococcus haemolyticus]MCH4520154.1 hypothetical protein [Staphylococcus haemolyticus]MDR5621881.1 hypothetical protein [Staphylococcus haemolyticus]